MNHVLLILICCILFVTSQAGSASSGVDLLPLLQPPNVLHSRFWTRYLHSFVTMGQKPFTHFGASQESSSEGCLVRVLAKDLSPSPRLAVESAEGAASSAVQNIFEKLCSAAKISIRHPGRRTMLNVEELLE